MNANKRPYLSKVLWLNAIVAVSALFVPGVSVWIGVHPTEVMVGFTVINIILRLITKDKITLVD